VNTPGARVSNGPPPDPNALRRDKPSDKHRDRLGVTHLPGEGSSLPAPAWPFPTPADDIELAIWNAEWKRPQAVMWHANNLAMEVALYVRALIAAEKPGASDARLRNARSFMDSLGISLAGLRFHQWQIDEPLAVMARKAAAETPTTRARRTPRGSSTRSRLGILRATG